MIFKHEGHQVHKDLLIDGCITLVKTCLKDSQKGVFSLHRALNLVTFVYFVVNWLK